MKNIVKIFNLILFVMLFTSCYDRDVIDYKEFDYSLPKVENLNQTKQGTSVKLTWQIPSNISADFKRPLEVSIQVVENDIYKNIIVVGGEKTSVDIPIDTNKKYRFVVKLLGYLTNEAWVKGQPDRVYSEGQVIEVQ